MAQNGGVNRRRYPRFILTLPLELHNDEFRLETVTQNISCSGVYCQIDRYIPVKTKLKVTMRVPLMDEEHKRRKTISCASIIARVDPPENRGEGVYNVGITFSQLVGEDREALLEFIHRKNIREAQELKKMYLQLKEMAARLVEVEECHPTATHFRKIIDKAIMELDAVAHILDYEINELKQLE